MRDEGVSQISRATDRWHYAAQGTVGDSMGTVGDAGGHQASQGAVGGAGGLSTTFEARGKWAWRTAQCRGVTPFSFPNVTSAPLSTRTLARSHILLLTAINKAVSRSLLLRSILAPRSNSAFGVLAEGGGGCFLAL